MPYEEKIVSNIEQMVGGDGQPLWVTYFEGKKLTFSEKAEPTWKKGEQLPFKVKVVNPLGQPWYYVRSEGGGEPSPPAYAKSTPKSAPPRTYGKSAEEQASIERQVDKKIASEIYRHVTEPGTPFDRELFGQLFRACQALEADVVDVAKRAYGAVEK